MAPYGSTSTKESTVSSSAKVILDSIDTITEARVSTLEVVMHRFVLAEFNTHRAFSRNSASSRAIPVAKQLAKVRENPAIPLSFPAEQKGMQGGDELSDDQRLIAEALWISASKEAARMAEEMADLGVHKSVTNRLLEPFMWHTAVVTSVEWDNFFAQRCSPLAQPEIRATAEAMREALMNSTPTELGVNDWHTPYIDDVTDHEVRHGYHNPQSTLCKISAMRCARVSYLTQAGVRDPKEDLDKYEGLVNPNGGPPHWSPLEHVCRPPVGHEIRHGVPGNLQPFVQLRHVVSGEV